MPPLFVSKRMVSTLDVGITCFSSQGSCRVEERSGYFELMLAAPTALVLRMGMMYGPRSMCIGRNVTLGCKPDCGATDIGC